MALDPRFFTAPSLQMYFVDKVTGLPLAAGIVRFFKDQARTEPKSVYKISGTPPNYTYTDIGSEITLTGVGTFSDSLGNDIIPYYFPFEGTPDDTDDTVELYYIQVLSVGEVEQFTREGWPNEAAGGGGGNSLDSLNYIPNGQFLCHTDIPEDVVNGYAAGEIRKDITDIAWGNFSYERSAGSTSIDYVVFDRLGDYVDNPTSSPRYVVNVSCASVGNGADYKDIRVKFYDVNKFASLTQQYTFSIAGLTNAGTGIQLQAYLIKNFGSGGSAETEVEIGVCNLTDSYTISNIHFIFGTNEDETIGPDNDDFVQLAIRFPADQIFNVSVANFMSVLGVVNITSFPAITDAEFVSQSLVPAVPNPQGWDLGLPFVGTLAGAEYDHSLVGKVYDSVIYAQTLKWHHLCNGSQLLTSGYQDTGVPNARLQSALWDSTHVIPIFGTGVNYVTGITADPATDNKLSIHTNILGAVTATADGAVTTGFTFTQYHIGDAGYGVSSFWRSTNSSFIIWNTALGSVTTAGNGNSGFSHTTIRKGDTLTAEITQFIPTVATLLASKYFTFNIVGTAYYVWYKVDTVGTDPAPGGTGILINLLSTDSAAIVAQKTSNGLNGWEGSLVQVTAAVSITPGAYFTFSALGGATTSYYCYYTVDGVGADPELVGKYAIEIPLLIADTNLQVKVKTASAINSQYFALPDGRGQFKIGNDPTQLYDYDIRYSFYNDGLGIGMGSFEMDNNLSHKHDYFIASTLQPQTGIDTPCWTTLTATPTAASGGPSAHPYNMAVSYFIHY